MGASVGTSVSRRRRSVSADINITPFVDVMLVLLIIFMVTSPMLVAGLNIDLPNTEAAPLSGQDEPISLDIDKNGVVYLHETPITEEDLVTKLKAITKEKYDTRIFVRGDKDVDYGTVINVIGALNNSGFSKVALLTGIKHSSKKDKK